MSTERRLEAWGQMGRERKKEREREKTEKS